MQKTASVARERLWPVFVLPLTQPINAGRGGRRVDSVNRARIAVGVRGPRADASESTRRAECAAECPSLHVIHSPAGSLSAWRRRAMQPGGVSANDTRVAEGICVAAARRRLSERYTRRGGVILRLVRVVPLLLLLIACRRTGGEYVVHRASAPVQIDGVLAEADWDRAEKAGPFVRSLDGKPAGAATEARLLWDDDHLYVAFLAVDSDVSGAFFRDDEKLYTSNVVEIFLNPSGDGSRYDEIEVAPTNALFDASFSGGPRQGMDLSWSSQARHAVHVDGTLNDPRDVDGGWTVELAIPFASLTGMPRPRPQRGDRWKFNLYRLRQGPGPH